MNIDRKQYEEELQRKQREHLAKVKDRGDSNWRPCLHDSCPQCFGTGIRLDGGHCFHNLSCQCPKCIIYC